MTSKQTPSESTPSLVANAPLPTLSQEALDEAFPPIAPSLLAHHDEDLHTDDHADTIPERALPFAAQAKRAGRIRWLKRIATTCILLGLLALLAIAGLFWHLSHDLPTLKTLKDYRPFLITRVYAVDGSIAMELAHQRRTPIAYDEGPKHMIQAIVAAEDADFFKHQGIDYLGIARAFWRNIWKRTGSRHGGSTITQQVVKTFLLSPQQTYKRKIREAILARRLESNLTKDDILFLYLNQVNFGNRRYGIQEAAKYYFNKPAQKLLLDECAILAGMLKHPEYYNPVHSKRLAKRRRDYVLKRMWHEGYIDQKTYTQHVNKPIATPQPPPPPPFSSDYYTEEVRRRAIVLLERYLSTRIKDPKKRRIEALNMLYRKGLRIETALSPRAQRLAKRAMRQGLRKLDRRYGYRGPIRHIPAKHYTKELAYLRKQTRALPKDKRRQALVTHTSSQGVHISTGQQKGVIPWSSLSWATKRPLKNGTQRTVHRKKLLSKGDLIWVRPHPNTPQEFSLEQQPKLQGALIMIEPMTHRVRALVGGRDFRSNSFNRAVQAKRQPGSTFKPIVYAAAIQSQQYTTASQINDAYFEVVTKGKRWIPKNDNKRYLNRPVRIREALSKSINTVAVRVLSRMTPERVIQFAQKLGIHSKLTPVLPLALGASSVQPLELTNAYATFAAQGIYDDPVFVTRILDDDDRVIYERLTNPRRVLSAGVAYIMNDLLQDVVRKGTARRARVLKRPIAGKTGTTNKVRDAWFVGYTPDVCTGVWIGHDDQTRLTIGSHASNTALPIFVDFMKQLHIDKGGQTLPIKPFAIPDDIQFVKIDPSSGLLAPPNFTNFVFEVFLPGTQPTQYANNPDPLTNPIDL